MTNQDPLRPVVSEADGLSNATGGAVGVDIPVSQIVSTVQGTVGDLGAVSLIPHWLKPSPPKALLAESGPERGELRLDWEAAEGAHGPILNYTVYASTSMTGTYERLVKLPAEETEHVHASLADGTTQYYRVSATNAFGEGSASNVAFATTYSVPQQVSRVTATPGPGKGQIEVTWTPPLFDGSMPVERYRLEASTDQQGSYETVAVVADTLRYTHRGLPDDHQLYYRVAAGNELGYGKDSTPAGASTLPPLTATQAEGPDKRPDACKGADCDEPAPASQPDGRPTPRITGTTNEIGVPVPGVPASAMATGLIVTGISLTFPVLNLYRRVIAAKAFENRIRRSAHGYVKENPGATTADVAHTLQVHYSTARHHLDVLGSLAEIEARRIAGRTRWFLNHRSYGVVEKKTAAALAVPSQRRILEHLAYREALPAGEIARRLGLAPATMSHHLKRLCALGLVKRERVAQRVLVQLDPEVPRALESLGAPKGA